MRRIVLRTLLPITFLGVMGCVEISTDPKSTPFQFGEDYNQINPMEHDLPCVELFDSPEYYTPIDSSTTCPECSIKRPVGYTVDLLEGSCTKARFTLYHFKQIYGCYKYCDGKETRL